MSDLLNEIIYKRCDEILLNDELYRRSNEKIVSLECSMKKSFSPQQLEDYKEIEQAIMEASAHRETILYRQGFIDGKSILEAK
jgi:hypothetical protein